MSKSSKPQPWYAAFNQPPRSPAHGRNWKPTPSSHRHPADRTNSGVDPGSQDTTAITFHTNITYPIFAEPVAPSIPHAGIRAGELTGYRLWWVTEAMDLCSLAHHFIWQPGATIEGKIDEPVDTNLFRLFDPLYGGVYCFFDFAGAEKDIRDVCKTTFPKIGYFDYFHNIKVLGVAWGTIKLWGEVVEHERGYRAQFAKLTSLDGSHGAFYLSDLRRKYNV